MLAAAVGTVLLTGGCGQVSVGEPEQSRTAGAGDTATTTGGAARLDPGPGAPEGCAELVGPLHRLLTREGDPTATAEEVRRLADGTADNALSAVARRLSGLSAQPIPDPVALDTEWDQVRRICALS